MAAASAAAAMAAAMAAAGKCRVVASHVDVGVLVAVSLSVVASVVEIFWVMHGSLEAESRFDDRYTSNSSRRGAHHARWFFF